MQKDCAAEIEAAIALHQQGHIDAAIERYRAHAACCQADARLAFMLGHE